MRIQVPDLLSQFKTGGTLSDSSLGALAAAGINKGLKNKEQSDKLLEYRWKPEAYIKDKLGWFPWSGSDYDADGQQEIIDAYILALRQQHEKSAFENGLITEEELTYWKPGETIQNIIRVEAGHTVGKTKLASGLVNHFFDCFTPSILYTFAPTWLQVHDLLWKEIKTDRRGKGLPGRILDLRLEVADDHFAIGRATNDAGGRGTERAQGQHGKYLMFVLDEAEGVADFVYGAVDSMASGGIVVVLLLANPRTRTSKFHKIKSRASCRSFRLSCVNHPNVREGKELVPSAVKRDYVETMLEEHCEEVDSHNDDEHTFELPWRPGMIYRPDPEYMFRVLGIPPKNSTIDTLISTGRYEAALAREIADADPTQARMGVDVARFGNDFGTLYLRHRGEIRRLARFAKQDYKVYAGTIKEHALGLVQAGVSSLHIRVDGGGGFGGGVIDILKSDLELIAAFERKDFRLFEVHNNGTAHNEKKYADLVTEMYAEAGETLKGVSLSGPPNELEEDLCDRKYDWANKSGVEVKRLESKKEFRKRNHRSPDDGDGFILCAAPDFLFTKSCDAGIAAALRGARIYGR